MNQIPPSYPASSRGEEYETRSPKISEQHHSKNEEFDSKIQEYEKKEKIYLGMANENKVHPWLSKDS